MSGPDNQRFWFPRFPMLRLGKPKTPEKEYNLPSARLRYPTRLYAEHLDDRFGPTTAAIDAIKLGALADRHRLNHAVLNEKLRVKDIDPFPMPKDEFAHILTLSQSLIEFIKRETILLNGQISEDMVNGWFQRAVNLHHLFADTNAAYLDIDGQQFSPDHEGIGQAWSSAGLPEFEQRPTDNGTILTFGIELDDE